MSRYVDIDIIKEEIDNTEWYHINEHGELISGARSDLIPLYKAGDIFKVIDKVSSIDIVRCEECRYCTYQIDTRKDYCVRHSEPIYNSQGFCSYGERKE